MNIDKIDIQIVINLYNLKKDEEITTWNLTKKVYPDSKDYNELHNKEAFIRGRLKKLWAHGLVDIVDMKGKTVYNLISDNISFETFSVNSEKKKALCLKIDGYWTASEID